MAVSLVLFYIYTIFEQNEKENRAEGQVKSEIDRTNRSVAELLGW